MANVAHIAIHAGEDLVVVRAGVSGIDESLHGRYGILFLTEQFAIVIAGMHILVRIDPLPLIQGLISLRQRNAVATHLPR